MPDADYTSKYYFIKGLTRPDRRLCAKITLVAPNAERSGLSDKYRRIFGDISEIIDIREIKEFKIGKKTFKAPKILGYEFGEEKFIVINEKFEDWVKNF